MSNALKEIAQFGDENRKMGKEYDNFGHFPNLRVRGRGGIIIKK